MVEQVKALVEGGPGSPDIPEAVGGAVPVPVGSGASTAVGAFVRTRCLPRTAVSARSARLLVARALREWGLEALEDAARLVVTELVSNAVSHAQMDTVRVTVTLLGPRRVRVAVVDRSTALPRTRNASPQEESGRGLEIVAALCNGRWGADPLPWGKRLWGDLEMGADG